MLAYKAEEFERYQIKALAFNADTEIDPTLWAVNTTPDFCAGLISSKYYRERYEIFSLPLSSV